MKATRLPLSSARCDDVRGGQGLAEAGRRLKHRPPLSRGERGAQLEQGPFLMRPEWAKVVGHSDRLRSRVRRERERLPGAR